MIYKKQRFLPLLFIIILYYYKIVEKPFSISIAPVRNRGGSLVKYKNIFEFQNSFFHYTNTISTLSTFIEYHQVTRKVQNYLRMLICFMQIDVMVCVHKISGVLVVPSSLSLHVLRETFQ
jgi:hypothetical protein